MALTLDQVNHAYERLVREIIKSGAMGFTKPELKQAVQDAEAWAETPSVKADFNSNLTAGNFKTNATADQKRLALVYALLSIVEG